MSAARTIAGDMDPEAIGDMIADGIRTAAAMRRRWRRSTTRGGKRRPTLADPTIDEQIRSVRRDLSLRERKYPKRVMAGRMTAAQADRETNAMRAVLSTLERVREQDRPSLFGGGNG